MFFKNLSTAPADPVFGQFQIFQADPRTDKIDLMVGIYRDEQLQERLLPVVAEVKKLLLPEDQKADYLPIDGLKALSSQIGELLFGPLWGKKHIYGAHTTGGAAALRIGTELLSRHLTKKLYIPNQSWPGHPVILSQGGCELESYSYFSMERGDFDLAAMVESFDSIPAGSAVLLHASCHNPTGCDPSLEEWKSISREMKKRHLFPFFDCAYQGFGSGLDQDAEAIRLFAEDGHELFIAYSCSKNFGLYRQRVGAFFVVCESAEVQTRVGSQVKRIARGLYSNPPSHGACIVAHILGDRALKERWEQEVHGMNRRIYKMRAGLADQLHMPSIVHGKGMFCLMNLSKAAVQQLRDQFGIYLLDTGRLNLAGLTEENLTKVAHGLLTVL